jgi:hypothetical protein
MRWLFLLLLLLSPAGPVQGVIIDSENGSGNTSAPSPDPGWDHVGVLGGLTAIYLGEGAILTANHVGTGSVTLGGVPYDFVPGSKVRLDNGDGTFADLALFAIYPEPPLGTLPIAAVLPPIGTQIILIGKGRNRGAATSWDPNGPPPPGPLGGYEWAGSTALRWGSNFVEEHTPDRVFDTEVFGSRFDEAGSAHEGQATNGDSGGAAFAWNGSGYDLAGIMTATADYVGQPANTSLYTQLTYAANLAFYRTQIESLIALPEPRGAVWAGVALLAVLARRRSPVSREGVGSS